MVLRQASWAGQPCVTLSEVVIWPHVVPLRAGGSGKGRPDTRRSSTQATVLIVNSEPSS